MKITEGVKVRMAGELERILEYVEVLNTLDTAAVEPMSHVFPVKNVFRADVVEPSADRRDLLRNAPIPDEEAFLVPKTVE
mgnify:FL=1